MGAGQEQTLLVRIEIHRIVNEIIANPAVVEQGIALGWRTITDNGLFLPLGLDEK